MKRALWYLPGALIVLGLLLVHPFSRADEALRVGAAERDITPREPLPMWGYSARHDSLSQGVRDPLKAEAVVLQLQGRKLAIVALDLGRPPAESSLQTIRRRIRSDAGIEYSFIAASHTHHGPVVELSDEKGKGKERFATAFRYYAQLEDAIVKAVVEANERLAPARMAAGKTELTDLNINRQTHFATGSSDRDLTVLRFDDLSGKPIALLVNFAAHPTLLPPTDLQLSADYVGVLKQAVAQKTGAVVLFLQGAAGDQGPAGPGDYVSYGQELADHAVALATNLHQMGTNRTSLQMDEKEFQFPSRLDLRDAAIRRAADRAFFPEFVANYADQYSRGVRPRLTLAVLNDDVVLVGVSGEFFSSHSIRLKERARVAHLLFIGYCNGYCQYFPTIEAAAEGGDGTDEMNAPAPIGAGEQIMDTALISIYKMLGQIEARTP